MNESTIFNMFKADKVQVKYYLDELERYEFIKVGYAAGGRYFNATPTGRKWIVENGAGELIKNALTIMRK